MRHVDGDPEDSEDDCFCRHPAYGAATTLPVTTCRAGREFVFAQRMTIHLNRISPS